MDRKCNIIEDSGCRSVISALKPEITEENLVKISNRGIYKRGLKDAENVSEAAVSFAEGYLSVSYDDVNVRIRSDISSTSCSCRSRTVCRHVITAMIILQECGVEAAEKNTVSEPEKEPVPLSESECEKESDCPVPDQVYLKEIMEYIKRMMKKGLINCDTSDVDILSQLSLKGENTVHNNISLMMRRLSVQIKKMTERSADFSLTDTFHLICRISNTVSAVAANEHDSEKLKVLCYSGRETYENRGMLTFYGLGAYPWTTESGYTGVTVLLFCEEDRRIYTYSSSITYIHENTRKYSDSKSLSQLFKSKSHWQNSVSLSQISGAVFRLLECKTNSQGRISSSGSSSVIITGCNTYYKTEIMGLSADNVFGIPDEYDYFSGKKEEKICAVKFDSIGNLKYNKVRQVLEFEISDGKKNYPCEIVWNEYSKNAVSSVEDIAVRGLKSRSFFICRCCRDILVPVSIVNDEKVRSLGFE